MADARVDKRSGSLLCTALLLLLAVPGCGSLGPRTAQVDQASYAVALSEAQKSLLLTNIVRMRYGEPASFVSLAQIVQGYTLRGSADAGIDFGLLPDETPTVGGNLTYEDRPTLTLTPIQGRDFRAGFLVPVPPQSVVSALVIGWPPDLVLRLGVQSINGIPNALISGDRSSDADPRFLRIAELMQELIVGNVIELALEPRARAPRPCSSSAIPIAARPPTSRCCRNSANSWGCQPKQTGFRSNSAVPARGAAIWSTSRPAAISRCSMPWPRPSTCPPGMWRPVSPNEPLRMTRSAAGRRWRSARVRPIRAPCM
jgi:hypothetical protein